MTYRYVRNTDETMTAHADHNGEEWRAYVNDTTGAPDYVTGDSSGYACHDCEVIIVDVSADDVPADETRMAALAAHLGYDVDAYAPTGYADHTYTDGGAEYLVVTDQEADELASAAIRESLWAFNAEWLTEWVRIPVPAIRAIQEAMYEDASDVFAELIGDRFDEFVDESIGADGRGHFLSGYDGNELELESGLYAFRVA